LNPLQRNDFLENKKAQTCFLYIFANKSSMKMGPNHLDHLQKRAAVISRPIPTSYKQAAQMQILALCAPYRRWSCITQDRPSDYWAAQGYLI
jgi:hypothetical protein